MRVQGDRDAVAASASAQPSARALACVLVLVGFAVACGSGAPRGQSARDPDSASDVRGEASGGEDVSFDSVYASDQSGLSTPMRKLVRSEDEWAAVWRLIAGDRDPIPPAPPVDFERSMLLAVGLGSRPSGGYAARIAGIEPQDGRLTVTVEEIAPGEGCLATMALTAPVIVVRLERMDADVDFQEVRRERACD